MRKISDHITYAEATKSQLAVRHNLDNTPNEFQLRRMKETAKRIFEPVRLFFDVMICVSSFFRSPAVNVKAGGSQTSGHCRGDSIDMDADVFGGVTNRELFYYIKNNLVFDQLIWEYGNKQDPAWVHASYRTGFNRMQVLRAIRKLNKRKTILRGRKVYETKYIPFDLCKN